MIEYQKKTRKTYVSASVSVYTHVCVCVCVCVRVHTLSDVQLFASYTWAQIEMFWHKLPHKEKLLS